MATFILLLRMNLAFILLFGCYQLFLRKSPLFAANRAWLLLAPMAALLLPFLHLPTPAPLAHMLELAPLTVGSSAPVKTAAPTALPALGDVLWSAYLTGIIFSLMLLGVRYVQAWGNSHRPGAGPLSFFRHIALPSDAAGDDARALAAHEQAHVQHGHSYDVLYYELLIAFSWWNPVWRLALHQLRTVHELQADAAASTLHPDYHRLLLARALGVPTSTLVNSFRSSNLKTRITMLHMPTSRYAKLKYTIAVPALAGALLAVSCTRSEEPATAPTAPSTTNVQPLQDLSQLDVQPEFPGGMEAMYAYLRDHIHYPDQAFKDRLEGKVYVEFTVETDGKVTDVKVRRGPRQDLNDEAVRAVASMPNWTPGQKAGQAVATRFTVPVSFVLQKDTAKGSE
jgi:TonB family protein